MKERAQQFGTPPGLVDGPVRLQFQGRQVLRNVLGQVAILRMVSQKILNRIQVRGARRQPPDPEPFVRRQGLGSPAVDRPPIYHHDQLSAQRPLHLPEECFDLIGRRVHLVQRKVQTDPSPSRRAAQCRNHAQPVVPVPAIHQRRRSLRRPTVGACPDAVRLSTPLARGPRTPGAIELPKHVKYPRLWRPSPVSWPLPTTKRPIPVAAPIVLPILSVSWKSLSIH